MEQKLNDFLTLEPQQALHELRSSLQGLTTREAKQRLKLYGPNKFVTNPVRSHILEAISHSINPLVIILIIAAFISFFTGTSTNALIIFITSVRSLQSVEKRS
jgi:Mg2+-importing ATPase